jgi:peptidoglycan hydrolase-like protein with peptidoglycan-binding domain
VVLRSIGVKTHYYMKKLLILSLIIVGAYAMVAGSAQADVVTHFATLQCPRAGLTFGSRGAEVTKLQQILVEQKLLTVAPTGYFGVLTKRAVATYQAKNGIVPAAGYFGPITRGVMLAADVCGNNPTTPQPDPTNGVTITSPKGDVNWERYTHQKITWTDSKVYIQAPKYDVKIQLDHCEPNGPCTLIYHIPITIAKDVADTTFAWQVPDKDTSVSGNTKIADGKYRVFICAAGTPADDLNGCAKSSGKVHITSASSQPGTTKPIEISASVGKKIYSQNESFDITITAKNTTAAVKKLDFTSSCQVSYKIDNLYNYMAARLCMMALTEVTLQAGETKTWTITHDPAEFKIPTGTHTITAEVIGNGSANVQITVQ